METTGARRVAVSSWPELLALVATAFVLGPVAWVVTLFAYVVLVFDSYGHVSVRIVATVVFLVVAVAIWFAVGLGAGLVAGALGDPPYAALAVVVPVAVPFVVWQGLSVATSLEELVVPLLFAGAVSVGVWLGMRTAARLRRPRAGETVPA